jgi:foldase protein PrsA
MTALRTLEPARLNHRFDMSSLVHTAFRAARRPRVLVLPVVLCASVLAACGDDVSPNAVARVGDETIEKSEFDHWLEAAARTQQTALTPGGAQEVAVPTPPDFPECVEAKEEQATAAAPGGRNAPEPEPPPTEELRQQCEEEYDLLKEQVMQFLIQAEAVEQEAEERDVTVTDEEVQSQFEDLKEQSFPNDEQFQQFLETSGMTEDDLLFRVRLDLLISEIRDDVLAEEGDVSDEEIEAYYEENKDQPPIGQPEQREVRVVVTESEEEAEEARQAIEDGDSWERVAKEFSIDPASRDRGGKLTVQEGAEEGEFDEAVFSAEEGELTGPIETELGWYVFEVTDVRKPKTESLEDSREAIVQIIQAEREQEALTAFQEQFEDEVREETICAEEFVIVGCENGPAPEEAPEPGAPVAPPSGAPPSGAPAPPPPGGGAPPAPPPPSGAPPAPPPPSGAPPAPPPPSGAPPAPAPGGGGSGG